MSGHRKGHGFGYLHLDRHYAGDDWRTVDRVRQAPEHSVREEQGNPLVRWGIAVPVDLLRVQCRGIARLECASPLLALFKPQSFCQSIQIRTVESELAGCGGQIMLIARQAV